MAEAGLVLIGNQIICISCRQTFKADADGWFRIQHSCSTGTLDTRQRAKRAARRIYNEINGMPDVPEMTDIIAAEFEK